MVPATLKSEVEEKELRLAAGEAKQENGNSVNPADMSMQMGLH